VFPPSQPTSAQSSLVVVKMMTLKRFKEHEAAFRHNPNASSFAKHLTENNHSFGPMPNIMQPLQLHKRGPHLNTLEKFHIYTEFRANNHLNDEHSITTNAIFNTLCQVKTT